MPLSSWVEAAQLKPLHLILFILRAIEEKGFPILFAGMAGGLGALQLL
jgi:hypothetical protein